jgi:hypothetical protein
MKTCAGRAALTSAPTRQLRVGDEFGPTLRPFTLRTLGEPAQCTEPGTGKTASKAVSPASGPLGRTARSPVSTPAEPSAVAVREGCWAARLTFSAGQMTQDTYRRRRPRYRIVTFIAAGREASSALPAIVATHMHSVIDRQFCGIQEDPGLGSPSRPCEWTRGYVLRREGRSGEAIEEYRKALEAIEGKSGEANVRVRAEIRQSLSNVYGDSDRPDEALRILRVSIADLESFIETSQSPPSAQVRSDLADAYQRCANKLATLGEYARAHAAAFRGLALYDELISEGSSQLLLDAARLRGAYGLILDQLGDLDGAIAALSASREAMAHVAPGTTTLRDLVGPAAPPIPIDAMVKGTDSILADLKRRRGTPGQEPSLPG